ncbi:MAG: DUF6268 family outer membrane beta-barrel protein [Pseudomonadota bacterium]
MVKKMGPSQKKYSRLSAFFPLWLCFLLCGPLFPPTAAWSWEGEHLFNIEGNFAPSSKVKHSSEKVEMFYGKASLNLPIYANDYFSSIMALEYSGYFLDYHNVESFIHPRNKEIVDQSDLPKDLHALDFLPGVAYRFNENWSSFLQAGPVLHSDLKNMSAQAYSWQGLLLGGYEPTDGGPRLVFGGAYNDMFGQGMFLPVLGVQWKLIERLKLDIILPIHAIASYHVAKGLGLGLKAKVDGHEFRLSEKKPWRNDVVKYQQIQAGPFLEIDAFRPLAWRLECGYVFNREVEFWNSKMKEKIGGGRFEESWFLGLTMRWVLE